MHMKWCMDRIDVCIESSVSLAVYWLDHWKSIFSIDRLGQSTQKSNVSVQMLPISWKSYQFSQAANILHLKLLGWNCSVWKSPKRKSWTTLKWIEKILWNFLFKVLMLLDIKQTLILKIFIFSLLLSLLKEL